MNQQLIITLIGMPGSGKSTVGALLATHLDLPLVDTDHLIEAREGQTLQQIMDGRGHKAFRQIEEAVLLEMPLAPSVISTGGSVVYSDQIMARLAKASTIVYLKARYETIEHRVSLAPLRGIASPGGQSLEEIYRERVPLYERYSELSFATDTGNPDDIARLIEAQLTHS